MTEEVEKPKLSRRQKRKLLQKNEKLKAPHCKNPSFEAREKVHLRIAGFSTSINNSNSPKENGKKKSQAKKRRDDDEKVDYLPSGRLLAGADTASRHKAVLHLQNYLKARCAFGSKGLSELDLMILWKGLWYTLYLADHVIVQEELSKRLAKLLWCVAGTQEQDECVGQAYVDLLQQDNQEEKEEEEEEEGEEEEEDYSDRDDNAEEETNSDVNMEEETKVKKQDDYIGNKHGKSDDEDISDDDNDDNDDKKNVNNKERDSEKEKVEVEDETKVCHCRGAHLACLLVQTCFRTIRREWGNMDKYRVDKFYMFIRYVIHEVYVYMARTNWNYGIVQMFNDAIMEEVLCCVPNGIRFHIIDISLEELAKVSCTEDQKVRMPLTEETFLDVMQPYIFLAQTGAGEKLVQERVLEKILESFLYKYSVVGDHALDGEQEKKNEEESNVGEKQNSLVFNEVHVGSVAKFLFDIASDEQTTDIYRKSLYDMHKKYMKRLKLVGKDVELAEEDTCANENRSDNHHDRPDNAYDEEVEYSNDSVENNARPRLENEEIVKKQVETSDNKKEELSTNEDGCNVEKSKKKKGKKEKRSKRQNEKQKQNETNDDNCATDENDIEDKNRPLSDSKRWEEDNNENLTGWEVEIEDEDTTQDTNILDMIDLNKTETKEEKKTDKEQRRKSKKKKENTSFLNESKVNFKNNSNEFDEDVTISISEQKKAKKKLRKELKKKRKAEAAATGEDSGDSVDINHNEKKKKRKKQNNDDDESNSESNRRVIFESKNKFRYKSYKASMKSLKTMGNPSPVRASKSPEKGILRKDTPIARKTSATVQKYNKQRKNNQQNRKRAVNYF